MTEAQLTAAVLELLDVLGWRAMHTRPARTAHGWVTPVQGPTAVGWPDILAVKGCRIVATELKIQRSKNGARPVAAPEQLAWLDGLAAAGVATFVWTDRDYLDGTIEAALR